MGLFSDRRLRSCYLWLFGTDRSRLEISLSERAFLSQPCKSRHGKNDISCVISCFRDYSMEKIEETTYTFLQFISCRGLVGPFNDRGPRSCYLWLFGTERSRLGISP